MEGSLAAAAAEAMQYRINIRKLMVTENCGAPRRPARTDANNEKIELKVIELMKNLQRTERGSH